LRSRATRRSHAKRAPTEFGSVIECLSIGPAEACGARKKRLKT